jgi:hypothetical protein
MEEFYKLLDKHIEGLNQKFQKFSIKQSLYDDIILILRDGWGDSQLKFWVNTCKVISVQSASNDVNTYQVCTTTAIISSRFQGLDLLNLSKCNFRELRAVDPATLPTMTFIQACKAYVNAGLFTPTEACNCNGNCSTKKCCCRAAKVQCGTKCHSSKNKTMLKCLV